MTLPLRILLVLAAICLVIFMIRGIQKSKMQIEDSISWVLLAFLILLLSIFPQIATALSDAIGFIAPVNFIFLFFIFVLLLKSFHSSLQVSQLNTRVKELSQQIAIDRLDHFERKEETDKHLQ